MSRKRGRITIQHQPTKETRAFERLAMVPFLVVSVFFVIIGITWLIPSSGIFGVIWTFMAGSFVVIAVVSMVRKNGFAQRVGYDVENDLDQSIVGIMEDVVETAPAGTIEERLKELRNLYDQRLITDEEYEAKRKEILEEL